MIRFYVSVVSEVFPFYSCVYFLHNYGIILRCYFEIRSRMAAEVLNVLSSLWAIGELFHCSLGGGIGYV